MTGRGSSPVNGGSSDCEESTPLLPSVPSNQNGDDSPSSSASYFMSSLTTRQKWKSAWRIWRIPVVCYTFALLIEFGDFIRSTPRTRLLESIICNRYYAEQALNNGSGVESLSGSHNYRLPIPEEQCKVPIVQAELVTLKAYLKIGENLLSLKFAIPFGYLANKTSRNFVLTLDANYLISFRAFVNLGLFLVILPIISRFFRKSRGMSPSKSDLWIARVSSIFGIIGPVMIGLSPCAELLIVALSLFTLSFGFHAAFQSYATSLVKPEEVALLYSALACMSIIGALIASPLIAATFRLGLSIGGLGIGLPFFVAAGFFTVSAIGAWGSRVEEDAND
ncbi:hypothetical protein HYALB_00006062 [Hymenoscyphus albidus]|uniref:Uncharacterized protein n=1 Tax=Hymenoscyphus albidus TaxID=595503 RepID=A0A9N9QC13_9HELO|nr:hypothetical protein HYALB_00006062 [Hymenoscyphus albidus]